MLKYIILFVVFVVGNSSRCYWINSTYEAVSYQQCLRIEQDLVSDRLKKPETNGIYQDCVLLVEIWKRLGVGYSNPSQWFVDAGSNIGSCGLLMAAHGIQTIAFEPNPDNLYYLRSSVNNNIHISVVTRVVGIGLGDVAASFPIFVEPHNAGNSVVGAAVNTGAKPAHMVSIKPLDGLIPEGVVIPLMKIDVQGFEHKLLLGARGLLARGVIQIIKFEVSRTWLEAQGTSPAEVYDLLVSYNYTILKQNFVTFPRSNFIENKSHIPDFHFDALACLNSVCHKICGAALVKSLRSTEVPVTDNSATRNLSFSLGVLCCILIIAIALGYKCIKAPKKLQR